MYCQNPFYTWRPLQSSDRYAGHVASSSLGSRVTFVGWMPGYSLFPWALPCSNRRIAKISSTLNFFVLSFLTRVFDRWLGGRERDPPCDEDPGRRSERKVACESVFVWSGGCKSYFMWFGILSEPLGWYDGSIAAALSWTKSLLGVCKCIKTSERVEDEDVRVWWIEYRGIVNERRINLTHSGKKERRRKMTDTQTQHV